MLRNFSLFDLIDIENRGIIMFMKKFIKKQMTLAIITFLMLGVVIFGSSYALFQKTFIDTKTQSLSVGDLSIVFSNGTIEHGKYVEMDDTDAINLTDIMPMTDAEAEADLAAELNRAEQNIQNNNNESTSDAQKNEDGTGLNSKTDTSSTSNYTQKNAMKSVSQLTGLINAEKLQELLSMHGEPLKQTEMDDFIKV